MCPNTTKDPIFKVTFKMSNFPFNMMVVVVSFPFQMIDCSPPSPVVDFRTARHRGTARASAAMYVTSHNQQNDLPLPICVLLLRGLHVVQCDMWFYQTPLGPTIWCETGGPDNDIYTRSSIYSGEHVDLYIPMRHNLPRHFLADVCICHIHRS